MLSGIGPADHLASLGTPVVTDLPGVGRNLRDRLDTSVKYACPQPVTLYGADRFPRNVLMYFLLGSDLGTTTHTEAGAAVMEGTGV